MEKTGNERNSGFELLRIIAMLMIVAHHFAYHGEFTFADSDLSLQRFWWYFLDMGGKVGVSLFVLISGYFLISNGEKGIRLPKLLTLWGQIFFYSLTISSVFLLYRYLYKGVPMTFNDVVRMLFPLTFSEWWFAGAYVLLYLFHPFLNRFLLSLDKAAFQKYLLLLVICWSVIPTIWSLNISYSGWNSRENVLWFLFLYSMAAYIRLYGLSPRLRRRDYLLLWGFFSLLTYLSSVVLCFCGKSQSVLASRADSLFGQDKLTVLLISLSLFMAFEKTELPYKRWINTVASGTFGVYLIHENRFVRPVLWLKLFKNASYRDTPLLIPYSLLVILLVYAVCTLIDLARKYLLERPFVRFVRRHEEQWTKALTRGIDRIRTAIFK